MHNKLVAKVSNLLQDVIYKCKLSGNVASELGTATQTFLAYSRTTGELIGSTIWDPVTHNFTLYLQEHPDQEVMLTRRDEGRVYFAETYDSLSLCSETFVHGSEYDQLEARDINLLMIADVTSLFHFPLNVEHENLRKITGNFHFTNNFVDGVLKVGTIIFPLPRKIRGIVNSDNTTIQYDGENNFIVGDISPSLNSDPLGDGSLLAGFPMQSNGKDVTGNFNAVEYDPSRFMSNGYDFVYTAPSPFTIPMIIDRSSIRTIVLDLNFLYSGNAANFEFFRIDGFSYAILYNNVLYFYTINGTTWTSSSFTLAGTYGSYSVKQIAFMFSTTGNDYVYADGILRLTKAVGIPSKYLNTHLSFTGYRGTSNHEVSISNIMIFNRLLTSEELTYLDSVNHKNKNSKIQQPSGINGIELYSDRLSLTGFSEDGLKYSFLKDGKFEGDNFSAFNSMVAGYVTLYANQIKFNNDRRQALIRPRYVTEFPNELSAATVVATSTYSAQYYPYFALSNNLNIIGAWTNVSWISINGTYTNQKFNVDVGRKIILKRIYLENGHSDGGSVNTGIKDFSIYGTNVSTAFTNTVFATLTDLNLLGTFQAAQHSAYNETDPQYFYFNNNAAPYRYYVLRITNNWGSTSYMSIRHIEFQYESPEFESFDESNIDIYLRFSALSVSTQQCIWKSGDQTDGVAIGIDATGHATIYASNSGVVTSSSFSATCSINTWYRFLLKGSDISLIADSSGEVIETKAHGLTFANYKGMESLGGAVGGNPINGTTQISSGLPFNGYISDLLITERDTLDIGVDDIRKHIIVKSGETELPVEIVKFDTDNNSMVLWTKVPEIKSSEDTVINISVSEASENVGYTGSEIAQKVWDDEFVGVYHMVPSSKLIDSTANHFDGELINIDATNFIDHPTGYSLQLNGVDEYAKIQCELLSDMQRASIFSVFKCDAIADGVRLVDIAASDSQDSDQQLLLEFNSSNNLNASLYETDSDLIGTVSSGVIGTSNDNFVAVDYTGKSTAGALSMKVNGVEVDTDTPTGKRVAYNSSAIHIGKDAFASTYFDGNLSELFISKKQLKPDIEKVMRLSMKDELGAYITEGSEEGFTGIRIDIATPLEQLVDFPVCIHLSSSCGLNDFDASAIFDELGSEYDKLYIKDGDDNNLLIEVEFWDSINKKAKLYVKVPIISSATSLYVYNSISDPINPNIGVIGSLQAQNVWDANFVLVMHMVSNGSTVTDSTSNSNNGSIVGSLSYNNDPTYGSYISFEGNASNYVYINDSNSLDVTKVTLDFVFRRRGGTNWNTTLLAKGYDSAYHLRGSSTVTPRFFTGSGNSSITVNDVVNTWNCASGSYTSGLMKGFSNGTLLDTITSLTGDLVVNNSPLTIGQVADYSPFTGDLAELRISKIDRSESWVNMTHLTILDNALTFVNVTSSVTKILKLRLVDSGTELQNFPLTVHLSDNCGTDNFDASYIFTMLGSDWNKLAFKDSSNNSLYAEVEQWDVANKKAVIHVKVPSIDTGDFIYMDYTPSNPSNPNIGESGSVTSQNVWDSNFCAVYHMNQDPTGGANCILDSTLNGNHGTPVGSWNSNKLVDTIYGKGLVINGDAAGNYINCGNDSSLNLTSSFTIEAVVIPNRSWTATNGKYLFMVSKKNSDWTQGYSLHIYESTATFKMYLESYLYSNGAAAHDYGVMNLNNNGLLKYYASTVEVGSVPSLYDNGVLFTTYSYSTAFTGATDSGLDLLIGEDHWTHANGWGLGGTYLEIRISRTKRSTDWINYTYKCVTDSAILFSVHSGGETIEQWTPAYITSDLWLDAQDLESIIIDSGVRQWSDKSGNSRHATQLTIGSRPIIDTVNTLPYVNFNGSTQWMYVSNLMSNISDIFTVFIVFSVENTAKINFIFSCSEYYGSAYSKFPFSIRYDYTVSKIQAVLDSGNNDWNADVTLSADRTTFDLVSVNNNPSASCGLYVNGNLVQSGTGVNISDSGLPYAIGRSSAEYGGGIGGSYFQGKIGEIIFVASDISVGDRQKFEGYLAHKWGLEGNLPSNHPYKTSHPKKTIVGSDSDNVITVNLTDPDSALSNFPILVYLSSSCGANSFNATSIFDELDDNWNKLLVKDSNGNPLYTEVIYWDSENNKAVIAANLGSLTTNGYITIDFNSTNAINPYIGMVGDSAVDNVWIDSLAIYHMEQNPTDGSNVIKDSSPNSFDLTTSGSMTSADLVDGPTGKSVDFDGSNDAGYRAISINSTGWSSVISIKIGDLSNYGTAKYVFHLGDNGDSGHQGVALYVNTNGTLLFMYYGTNWTGATSTLVVTPNSDNIIGVSFLNATQCHICINGESEIVTINSLPQTSIAYITLGAGRQYGAFLKYCPVIINEAYFYSVSLSASACNYLVKSLMDQTCTLSISSNNESPFVLWTPEYLDSTAWFDASDQDTVTLNGGYVSALSDKSGSGINLTQSTATNQPLYVEESLNGLNGIQFDGIDNYLIATQFHNPTVAEGINLFMVYKRVAETLVTYPISVCKGIVNNEWCIVHYAAPTNTLRWRSTNANEVQLNGTYPVSETPFLFSNIMNSSGMHSFNYGVTKGTTPTNPLFTAASSEFYLGGSSMLNTHNTNMVFYEMLLVYGVLTEATRRKIEGYLAHKWGLEGNLEITHPYKAEAPTRLLHESTDWTPYEIKTSLWFDAADSSTITLNGSTVSQWNDKSGNERNCSQGNASLQPLYNVGALNGLSVLTFDGSGRRLIGNWTKTLTERTLIIVFMHNGSGTNTRPFTQYKNGYDDWTTSNFVLPVCRNVGNSEIGIEHHSSGRVCNVPVSWNVPLLYTYAHGGGMAITSLNGGASSNSIALTLNTTVNHFIFGTNPVSDDARLNGYIAEIIVMDYLADTETINKIEGYLAWKWGIQGNLPVSHPYKTEKPIAYVPDTGDSLSEFSFSIPTGTVSQDIKNAPIMLAFNEESGLDSSNLTGLFTNIKSLYPSYTGNVIKKSYFGLQKSGLSDFEYPRTRREPGRRWDTRGCVRFDMFGQNGPFDVSSSISRTILSGTLTISMWVNPEFFRAAETILFGTGSEVSVSYVATSGKVICRHTSTSITSARSLSLMGWNHIVYRRNIITKVHSIFISGRKDIEAVYTASPTLSATAVYIGGNTTYPMTGQISDVLIFERELTDREIYYLCRG